MRIWLLTPTPLTTHHGFSPAESKAGCCSYEPGITTVSVYLEGLCYSTSMTHPFYQRHPLEAAHGVWPLPIPGPLLGAILLVTNDSAPHPS